MRSGARILGVALIMVPFSAPASAGSQTVTGQVVDLACYMLDKTNTGNAHRGRGYTCAQACAKEGFQVGLLAADGKVYQISGGLAANKNARLVPHVGHTVTITGEVSEQDGTVRITSSDLKMAN